MNTVPAGPTDDLFRTIFRQSLDGIIILDGQGTIVEWNESEEKITGIPRSEAVGRPIWEIQYRLAPEARRTSEYLRGAREKVLNGLNEGVNLQRTLEEDIQRPDGTRRTLQSTIYAIQCDDNLYACGICRDVTDLSRLDRELREHEEHLSLELAIAGRVQRGMLPAFLPVLSGYSISAFHEPCEDVGGDLYDVERLEDGRLVVVIGDVSGKGMGAALLMSNVIACLRVLYQECLDPYCMADRLHRELLESTGPSYFVTLFLGILDPVSHQLEYVNAGHNPPLLVCGGAEPRLLTATGPPLGLLSGTQYDVASVGVPLDSLLCLYSDGIPEARIGANFYGDERFRDNLLFLRSRPLGEIMEGILQDVRMFLGSTPPSDDMTLCLLRRGADTAA